MYFTMIIAFIKFQFLMFFNWQIVRIMKSVAKEILLCQNTCWRNNVFYLLVGFAKSGKTTYLRSQYDLKKCFKISTNEIHDMLNRRLPLLQDDNTIHGQAYWYRQFMTRRVRKMLLSMALREEFSIVIDAANLRRRERRWWLSLARKYGYKRYMVWVKCDETELMRRLKDADGFSGSTWQDLYLHVQKPSFQEPLAREADRIFEVET